MGKDLNNKDIGANFRQQKRGWYEFRKTINGQTIVLYGNDLSELKQRVEEHLNNLKKEHGLLPKNITLSDFFSFWLETYKRRTIRTSTLLLDYSKFRNGIGKILGHIEVRKLNEMHIQKAINQLSDQGLSYDNIRFQKNTLNSCLDVAVMNGIYHGMNPCRFCVVPKNSLEYKDDDMMDIKLYEDFIDYVYESNHFFCRFPKFAALSGLRIGEIGALTWDDIDFEKEWILVNKNLVAIYQNHQLSLEITPPKTKNSYRKVPFLKDMKKLLLEQKEQQEKLVEELGEEWIADRKDYVFTTINGNYFTRNRSQPFLNHRNYL